MAGMTGLTLPDDIDTPDETPDAHVSPETKPEPEKASFQAITTQEEFDAAIKQRIARAEKSAEKKAQAVVADLEAKIKGYEDAQLTADQKKDKRISELEKALGERDTELTKLQRDKLITNLASEHGLPKKLWGRVQGNTEDEITSDIQELLEAIPAAETKDAKKPPTQGGTVRVQPSGDSGEPMEDADAILEAISPRYR